MNNVSDWKTPIHYYSRIVQLRIHLYLTRVKYSKLWRLMTYILILFECYIKYIIWDYMFNNIFIIWYLCEYLDKKECFLASIRQPNTWYPLLVTSYRIWRGYRYTCMSLSCPQRTRYWAESNLHGGHRAAPHNPLSNTGKSFMKSFS